MDKLQVITPIRGADDYGSGEYGASRGGRKHNGIDFACVPGSICLALRAGTVTKHGWAYGDDPSWRYIEIQDEEGYRCRYFYVQPGADIDKRVDRGDPIGVVQDIRKRYPRTEEKPRGMESHVHVEVMDRDRAVYLNPEEYLSQ